MTWTSCTDNSKREQQQEDQTATAAERSLTQRYFEDIFLPGKEKTFRDVSLDLPIADVKDIETGYDLDLADESADFLQYEKDLRVDSTSGVDYVEVKYIFDQSDRLDIITVNYYLRDSTVINGLYDHLNTAFNDSYGDYYIDSDGYTVWEDTYMRSDSTNVTYDIAIRKLVKLNDPGITIEMMRFGSM